MTGDFTPSIENLITGGRVPYRVQGLDDPEAIGTLPIGGDEEVDYDALEVRWSNDENPNCWSSICALDPNFHLPVIDLDGDIDVARREVAEVLTDLIGPDVDVRYVPSRTSGHHHAYVEHPVSFEVYMQILGELAEAPLKVVQYGYWQAALRRGAAFVRIPPTVKEIP